MSKVNRSRRPRGVEMIRNSTMLEALNMGTRRRSKLARLLPVAVVAMALLGAPGSASAATSTFTNATPIKIPAGAPDMEGPAAPYPSTITVSGLPGPVLKARATLSGVSHTWPRDIRSLLVGPGGQRTILMNYACGGNTTPLTGQTLIFDDAAGPMTEDGPCPSGNYRPTDLDPEQVVPAPAPPGPYPATLSVFNGTAPNGAWQLFVFDAGSGDVGSISGGWSLELEHPPFPPCRGMPSTIFGTEGDDTLVGTPGPDVIAGLGGNDDISGLDGNDVICGAKGNDKLNGGEGNDTLLGQKGKDRLKGGPGKDKLSGKKGKDKLIGGGGKDKLKGGGGKDVCKGGKGKDKASKCEVEKSI